MIEEVNIGNGLKVFRTTNLTKDLLHFDTKIDNLYIQFHFNIKSAVDFRIIKGAHELALHEENDSLFFFNPKNIIPIDAYVHPKSEMLSFAFSLTAIHDLFEGFSIDFSLFNPQKSHKKLYTKRTLLPNEIIIINQIFSRKNTSKFDLIYFKSKIMEFLSYYFNAVAVGDDTCINLKDQRNVEKIKKAKQILLANINDLPNIEDLADEVFLPINVLKKGFKKLYGEPLYTFALNYKLELARKLLLSKAYSVKEVSYQVGYSAPTHFVVAFKKKFGITPKKYIQNLT